MGEALMTPMQGKPTIDLVELATLAHEAFGDEFVRIGVKSFKTRYEKITLYTMSKKPGTKTSRGSDWSHKLEFTNEHPPRDPDKVRLWLREFLQGIVDNKKEKTTEGVDAT
jgi:hypothetical protein